jgi:hypothetical protein
VRRPLGLAAAAGVVAGLLVPASPAAAVSCSQPQFQVVHQAATGQAEFLSGDAFHGGINCITNRGGTDNFVTSRVQWSFPAHDLVRSFPDLVVGCSLGGGCSPGSRLPRRVSALGSATLSWSTSHAGVTGHWNTGVDVWTSPGWVFRSRAAEVMVWLNERHQAAPGFAVRVTVAGQHYLRWAIPAASWTEIIYLRQPEVSSVSSLAIGAILADAATLGEGVSRSSIVQQIGGGFEMWTGGGGLSVSKYQVSLP